MSQTSDDAQIGYGDNGSSVDAVFDRDKRILVTMDDQYRLAESAQLLTAAAAHQKGSQLADDAGIVEAPMVGEGSLAAYSIIGKRENGGPIVARYSLPSARSNRRAWPPGGQRAG